MLNEYYGLPVEVIIMLLQYLQDMGKTNMKYIEKVAESWGDNEITTVDRAEKEIMLGVEMIQELPVVMQVWLSGRNKQRLQIYLNLPDIRLELSGSGI